ncbi:MAG: gluconate:H+ symporter [Pseudomonadota bacterium]
MDVVLENRAVLATIAGVAAIFILILRARMNAFAALMLVAILSALAAGMAPEATFQTVQKGMGGTLGFIAPIIGLGALFGVILEASGGVQAIAQRVASFGGVKTQRWSMGFLGIVAATPVFFDVALIILMPFIAGLATKTGRAAIGFGLPLVAGLAVGHAFVPPTPGPIAIAELIGADLGWVILFGSATGLVCVAVAGPIWTGLLDRRGALPMGQPALGDTLAQDEEPTAQSVSSGLAFALILSPLILILLGTMAGLLLPEGGLRDAMTIIGHPFSALLLASGAAWVCLRPSDEAGRTRMSSALSRAFEPTGVIILITGAGGAFKQVLVDTGAGAQLADHVLGLGFTPVVAGFVLALLVRVAQGSATVAMITAAGLAAPIVSMAGLSPPQLGLVTIAIAAGATGVSHVNDSGFWLVSRLFGLTEQETLRTWTMSTSLIAGTGLVTACLLYAVV